jgi:6-phosphogluconolactonase (cycloisomerase 2 family)
MSWAKLGGQAYCLNELDGTVSVIDLNASQDDAEQMFVPSSNRPTSLGSKPPSIRLSVDGSLTTAQRGIDTISWLRVDPGGLEVEREEAAGGLYPRDLLLTGGDGVVVVLQTSNSVRCLNPATGGNSELVAVPRPACLLRDPA